MRHTFIARDLGISMRLVLLIKEGKEPIFITFVIKVSMIV